MYFRFETHGEHHCDVMVISDNEQGYGQASDIRYQPPSGTLDGGRESVWDITLRSQVVESSVKVQDYNYRDANASFVGEINSQPKDTTTYGTDYRYDEHYKGLTTHGQAEKDGEEEDNNNNNNNDNNNNNTITTITTITTIITIAMTMTMTMTRAIITATILTTMRWKVVTGMREYVMNTPSVNKLSSTGKAIMPI
ncbi:contractile injection system protein, VgrG/Pvc8 family [Gilliamella sp. B2894]|uniref:contractile injection system protein, VgrG/Pvc8 family n=1 Tax=Gilliamella sp. B2894 TaxID=2817978 RepID=UPI003A5D198C